MKVSYTATVSLPNGNMARVKGETHIEDQLDRLSEKNMIFSIKCKILLDNIKPHKDLSTKNVQLHKFTCS